MEAIILDNLYNIGIFIGIILTTIFIAFLFNRFFKKLVKRSTETLKIDPTNYQFLRHFVVAVIYIVGFSTAIFLMPKLKTLASSLLAGAGIMAVAVGFASQQALSNIISGVFIIIFRPFRVNDRVKLGLLSGSIEDITLRHTVIRDFENRRILVPNSKISEEIIVNSDFGDNRICKWIEIGISYDSDIDKARQIMLEETLAHPLVVDNRTPAQIADGAGKVQVRVINLGEYAVTLRIWAWAKDQGDSFTLGTDLMESIKKRFDQEGIEIPFPYRTLVFKNQPVVNG